MATQFRYEKVVSQFANLIKGGTMLPGEKLPSVRKLSSSQSISVSTALHAYQLLEDRGFIEARPQSGYFVKPQIVNRPAVPKMSKPVCRPAEIENSALIIEVLEAISDPDIVALGAAVPAAELLPTKKLNQTLARVARAGGDHLNSYLFPKGSHNLRRAIAKRSIAWGCSFTPDEMIITSGCMEAISLCLRAVTSAGDIVAIESPAYFGVLQLLDSLQLKSLELATDPQTGICLDAVENAFENQNVKACVISANFQNPLGSLMTNDKKQKLVEMATKAQIPIIEDDLYASLYFGTTRPVALKSFDDDGWVMHCGSFSKTLAPGYRVGWTVPGRFMDAVKQAQYGGNISSCAPAQEAVASYLENGGYDNHLRRMRRTLRNNLERITESISRNFPKGTCVSRPAGGFVLWVEMPVQIDALTLYNRGMEKGISIAPGPIFSSAGGYKNCLRFNGGLELTPKVEDALKTLGEIAHDLQAKPAK